MLITNEIDARADELLKGMDIPPQPAVLVTIANERKKEFPDLKKIAAEITKDVALSAAVLRAANSPAFGLQKKVSSIPGAVMALGADVIFSITTALSLRLAMSGKKAVRLDRFWDTAADTAQICSVLATRLRVMPADQAYIMGLFANAGIPLLMQKFGNYIEVLKKGNQSADKTLTEIEDQELSTNHAVMGYLVSRKWFLPTEIRDAILNHHDESVVSQGGTAVARQVGLLMLAEHLCNLYRREGEGQIWERVGGSINDLFGLTEVEFTDLVADVNEILSAV